MKYFITVLLYLFVCGNLNAQTQIFDQATILQPYHLDITLHKTSVLIFPVAIQSADRGDAYVLAERVEGARNVLKVKAGKKDFEPSNLHVITTDGKVYTFSVSYAENPGQLTIDLRKQQSIAPVKFEGVSLNSKELDFYSGIVAAIEPFLKKGRFSKYGIEFYLQGVHIKNDVIFLSYRLKNHTKIKFDEASLRFYVRDKKKSKRTAVQDNEYSPIHVLRKGKSEGAYGQTIVAAFSQFTIAEDKYFTAELMELDGDRNPSSRLDQSVLLKSKPLR